MGGMRRNKRIVLKYFLVICYSLMKLNEVSIPGKSEGHDYSNVLCKHDQTFSFSAQSLEEKYKSHSQLNIVLHSLFVGFFFSFCSDVLYLTYLLKLASNCHYKTSVVVILECYFLNYPAAFCRQQWVVFGTICM